MAALLQELGVRLIAYIGDMLLLGESSAVCVCACVHMCVFVHVCAYVYVHALFISILMFNTQLALVSFSNAVDHVTTISIRSPLLPLPVHCCPSVTNLWQHTISLGDSYSSQEEYTLKTTIAHHI